MTVINRDKLSRLLQEGKIKRISVGSGVHADDIFGINARIKGYVLQPSDVVHRNLMDGDIGLINRQPSLHRLSMLGYRIRIADSEDNKILGIHLGATAGLNADFDGDELNFHAPQELEAIIEARTIANVENSIMFESSNVNVAGVAFDSLAAAYKLTSDQTIFTKKQFYELLSATYEVGLIGRVMFDELRSLAFRCFLAVQPFQVFWPLVSIIRRRMSESLMEF